MHEIILTQDKVALVDDEDYDYLNQWNWYAAKSRYVYYAQRMGFINGKHIIVKMHRILTNLTDPKLMVDHINNDGLDNQKANLRITTSGPNQINTNRIRGEVPYKGVTYRKDVDKFQSRITVNGRTFSLGFYTDPISAAEAYNEAAVKYYGSFAKV